MASQAQRIASRASRGARLEARLEWFGERVAAGIRMSMRTRVRFAAQYLRDKVVYNISYPVDKQRVGRRVQVVGRSRPGEFPRADTTHLMKTIFFTGSDLRYIVGTPVAYGLILETRMNRSFLVRTLREESENIRYILMGGRGVPGSRLFGYDGL